MKVFISWSGKRSQIIAKSLRTFLQDVNQRIEPWMSETDIQAGSRWAIDLANELEKTHFGIICLTPEAIQSPWLLFEAGALSKSVSNARVCPYLIEIEKKELSGPLAQFQCMEAKEESTFTLLQAINAAMENEKLAEDRLKKYFSMFWPNLKLSIDSIAEIMVLPALLKQELVEMLVSSFISVEQLEMVYAFSDLPRSRVNWRQALLYVCQEAVQVAFDAGKLIDFLNFVAKERPGREDVQELVKKAIEQLSSAKENK